MHASKTYLILFLSLTTIGGAVLSWRQYRELVELRASAMNQDERADLNRRVAELEKANRDLQDRLAAARLGTGDEVDELVAVATGERPRTESRGRGGRDGREGGRAERGSESQQAAALRELMNKPEVQAMLSTQQKAAIEARYAALFNNLNLNPAQAETLKRLLAERQTSVSDVMEAARAQGINPRENPEAMRKLIAEARNQVESGIKSLLGDSGYAQLQSYEQTMPQRNLVNELQQRLTYSNTPLTSHQAEQLVQILAANAPQRAATAGAPELQVQRGNWSGPGGPGGPGSMGGFSPSRGFDFGMISGGLGGPPLGGRGGSSAVITANAVAQSQGVLSQPQVAALQQLQQQQQAQQQLRQLVSETIAANQPQRSTTNSSATSSGSTGAAAKGTSPTPRRGKSGGGE